MMLQAALETEMPANVVLKGTARGLEIQIYGRPSVDALGERLCELLAEAPQFFAGSDARVAVDGMLPDGGLTVLERVASRFDLKIVEIAPKKAKPEPVAEPVATPSGRVVAEPVVTPSGRVAEVVVDVSAKIPPLQASLDPDALVQIVEDDPVVELPPGPRLVTGPVRSGVIVDHAGHVIVVGDVNPGAEGRATGSIIVLGRLRGVAHAAIGQHKGFIIALSLQPQQLRIGRMVARAGDADRPGAGAEIAYVTGETIVVERFTGRLPNGLAQGM